MLKSQSSAEKLKNKSQGGISQSILSKSDSDSDNDEKERKSSEPQLVFEDELQKKSNQDKLLTKSGPIDIGKEAAMEAEVKAARERQVVPLEQRMKQFRDLLTEKEISAFSTWEKELHKIVFDPRYLLLTSKERKQVFDRYVRDRAEEERREKRNRMKEKKDAFRKLLEDAKLTTKSGFSDFANKYGKDERFKGVEKMRDRESHFNEYLSELRKKEKEERIVKEKQIRKDFFAMLKERSDIVDRHSHWSDVRKALDTDSRYKAVESSSQKEDWFLDHIHDLKEDHRKEKEKKKRDRSRSPRKDDKSEKKKDKKRSRSRSRSREKSKKDKKKDKKRSSRSKSPRSRSKSPKRETKEEKEKRKREKEKRKAEEKERKREEKERKREQREREKEEGEMISEDEDDHKSKTSNSHFDDFEDHSEEMEVDRAKKDDERNGNEDDDKKAKRKRSESNDRDDEPSSEKKKQKKDKENPESDLEEEEREKREKEERIAASLKKREAEVARELSGHLHARDKEREQHRHHEAVSHFEALLVDLIRQPDYTWKEAKRILKKDARYESISANLEKSEREMRFDDHIDRLVAKKKENYRKMLEECKGIELDSSWKEIKKIIKDDPRYMKFSSSDRKCEKAFNEYLKDKMSRAKSAFKELLQETKKITDKSLSMVKEKDSGHMSEIIELLSKDKRYLDLESVEDERSNILTSYLEEIERRGPPPPPTASEPQRRSAKI